MSRAMIRRTIPLLLTFITGTVVILDFYIQGIPGVTQVVPILQKWSTIIWGFAMPYAVLMVFIDHIKVIQKREPEKWYYSIWMLLCIVVMTTLGVVEGPSGKNYMALFQYLAAPVLSTMTGMLSLYAISAAFRSWHARSPEALVMIIAGFLIALGVLAPIGEVMFPSLGVMGNWFMLYISKGERTVFYIATSLGAILLGFRTLIGQETSYLRAEAEE